MNESDPMGLKGCWYCIFDPWSHANPIYVGIQNDPNGLGAKLARLNPAYQTINDYNNEIQDVENGCSYWTSVQQGIGGAVAAASTAGVADGIAGSFTPSEGESVLVSGSSVGAETAGGGSGPWVDDALEEPTSGGAIGQASPGACGAACGAMVSDQSQAQLLNKLGEWTNTEALADALGQQGGGFASGEAAVARAEQGTMIARLQAPGGAGHFVVISPGEGGNFLVQDPFDGGSTYPVSSQWIEQYVSHGIWP